MTTVAYRNRQITADSALVGGAMKSGTVWKITRHEATGALCGFAGDASECMNFLANFRKHGMLDIQRHSYDFDISENSLGLIATKDGQLYLVEGRIIYPIEEEFYSIGSGAPFAMAAMKAGLGSIKAVRIAVDLDPFSGGQVRSLRHDKRAPCTE